MSLLKKVLAKMTASYGDEEVAAEVMKASGVDVAVAKVEARRAKERNAAVERRNELLDAIQKTTTEKRRELQAAKAALEEFNARVIREREQLGKAVQAAESEFKSAMEPFAAELHAVEAVLKGMESANSGGAAAAIDAHIQRLNGLRETIVIEGSGDPGSRGWTPTEKHVLTADSRRHAAEFLLDLHAKGKDLDQQINLSQAEFDRRLRELNDEAADVAIRYARWAQVPASSEGTRSFTWQTQGEVFYTLTGERLKKAVAA